MNINNQKVWAVLYQGEVCRIDENGDEHWKFAEGIQEADMTLKQAHAFADELNARNTDFEFWVVNETSPEFQRFWGDA